MKKRTLGCFIFILLLVVLTGCWNRRELNTLSIVQAVGIDRTENGQISLTFQILKPSEIKTLGSAGGGGGSKGVWTLTSTGQTIFDAFRNATMEADRKLFIPFNKIIVIGEEAARAGIAPLLDFFDRDHETRLRVYVLIARGKTKDIIEAEHEQEKVPADAIESLVKATFATSKIPKIDLHELLKTLASKTSDPFIPGIELLEKKKDEIDEMKEDEKTKKVVKLDGTAIFREDKLIGWFDEIETRGLLWILGKVKSGIIVVPSPREGTKNVALEIIKVSSEVKPEMINGRLVITVEVKEEGNLGEQMSESVDLTKPDTFKELEKKQAAAIKDEINAALIKAQKEWGVDIFKFGEAVHRKFPGEWKELKKSWDEEFQNIEVKVEVEAKLREVGMFTYPVKKEE
ncbi:MAG: spore gernimation protein GerC [Peptococcaceae bacterium BICA1-8]|nr:MAG: spore gernimation protein GerC [Peptococcaceae bacterium BICA1-8]